MTSLESKEKIIKCENLFEEKQDENALKNISNLSRDRILELESKCMEQKVKLKNCLPNGVIFHVVLYACALTCTIVLFITQIIEDYKLIDYYILLMLLIVFTGLLHTSIASLKKWKKFISMDEEE